MAKLIYSGIMSLDGYIADRALGDFRRANLDQTLPRRLRWKLASRITSGAASCCRVGHFMLQARPRGRRLVQFDRDGILLSTWASRGMVESRQVLRTATPDPLHQ
jgi:hypothetical protein